jgi:hypothetical protein
MVMARLNRKLSGATTLGTSSLPPLAAVAVVLTLLAFSPPAIADTSASVAGHTQRMTNPNLASQQDGWYEQGQSVTLVCSARGQAVQGVFSFNIPGGWDDLWYRTSDGHYVADVDIETGTLNVVAPDCGKLDGGGSQQSNVTNAETISGQIGCINNASPVGVWVQAQNSTSGWADHKVPIELGGLSKVDYSFTLDRGGPYQVHVGCGGTPASWASDIPSDNVTGSHDFLCNDMNQLEGAAWSAVRTEIFGAFGRKVDLTQGVPYGHCNTI